MLHYKHDFNKNVEVSPRSNRTKKRMSSESESVFACLNPEGIAICELQAVGCLPEPPPSYVGGHCENDE